MHYWTNTIKMRFLYYSIIFSTLLIGLIFIPGVSFAQNIIPCGTEANPSPCTICHLYYLVGNVVDFLITFILIPLAGFSLAWAGIKFILSGGNEGEVTRAKEILTNTVWGIIIALAAWLVVNTVVSLLIDPTSFPWPWQEFPTCSSS
jgi:hypothetical protein